MAKLSLIVEALDTEGGLDVGTLVMEELRWSLLMRSLSRCLWLH